MEVFLLLFDEIDDAVAILRSLWPHLLRLCLAVALLFATGFGFLAFPELTLPSVALLLCATLLDRIRHRPLGESHAPKR